MSKNLAQVFAANPVTTLGATDLMYIDQTATTDAAITGANFLAQVAPLTTKGDLYTFSTANTRLGVAVGDGKILQVSAGAATGLAWSTPTYPSASGTVNHYIVSDGTNNVYSANALVLGGAVTFSGAFAFTGTLTNTTTVTFPTSGTLATTSQFVNWNDVAGTSQAAAVNNGYIISNAAQTTVTLPALAAEGSIVAVQGKGAAGWILQANAGQTIHLGNTPTTVGGSYTSTNQWDAIEVICVTANTTWATRFVVGNLTPA